MFGSVIFTFRILGYTGGEHFLGRHFLQLLDEWAIRVWIVLTLAVLNRLYVQCVNSFLRIEELKRPILLKQAEVLAR